MHGTPAGEARLADRAEAAAFRDMCRAAPAVFRTATGLRCVEARGATLLIAPGIPSSMFNRVVGLGTAPGFSAADLDAVIGEFRAAGSASFWIHVNPVTGTPDLESWLLARGFRPARRRAWAKLLFGGPAEPATRTSLELREVGATHASALADVLVTAFEMPGSFAAWFSSLVGRPCWHAVAGFDGDRIVCGGFVYRNDDFAWLGIGGTLPEFRGRGGQSAMIAHRVRIAIDHGLHSIVTETGEPVAGEANPSFANLRRCGFRQVCSRLNYEPG